MPLFIGVPIINGYLPYIIHNRSRIIYEVIAEMRKRLGKTFPIMIKLNFDDFMKKNSGLTKEESIEVFKRIDELGIDMIEPSGINLSSGEGGSPSFKGVNAIEKQSYFKEAVTNIANVVKNTKVILVGGNKNFDLMDEILNSSKIQYFSLSRTLLCEPDLINKWMDNKDYKPKCVSCNKCWDVVPNSCVFNR